MKKIIFAFYPLFVRYNHGVALLSALCKARGIDVGLCVLGDPQAFVEQVQRERPQVIGFSCVTGQDYLASLPYIQAAKWMGCLVILGGVWAGLGKPVDPAVDFVCRGDGEGLPDFLLSGDTRIFDAPQVCRDIHSLPLPDYELFRDIPFERGLSYLVGKRVLPYYSSRGCNGSCSFCQIRYQPKGVRVRSRVKEDLEYLTKAYRPDVFFIGDAGLPYGNAAWRESWGDFRHPFVAYIRADIRPEHLAWLIDRGMIGCAFGVEAGDEQYRNAVLRKNLTDDALFRTVGILRDRNVDYVAFFMIGTPGETEAHRQKTLSMANTLGGSYVCFHYEDLAA